MKPGDMVIANGNFLLYKGNEDPWDFEDDLVQNTKIQFSYRQIAIILKAYKHTSIHTYVKIITQNGAIGWADIIWCNKIK